MNINLLDIFEVVENEVFELNGAPYKVMDNKLCIPIGFDLNGEWEPVGYSINKLVEAEFERLPFVPKEGEIYWSVSRLCGFNKDFEPYCYDNGFDEFDIMAFKLGLCYRTEQEAKEKGIPLMQQWLKELGGE